MKKDDPEFEAERAMQAALSACIRLGQSPRRYGGALVAPNGSKAWLEFRIVSASESVKLKSLGNTDGDREYNIALDDVINKLRKRWHKFGVPSNLETILIAIREMRK